MVENELTTMDDGWAGPRSFERVLGVESANFFILNGGCNVDSCLFDE